MDRAALEAFLARDFGQVAADFAVERADAAGIALRLKVAERITSDLARVAAA